MKVNLEERLNQIDELLTLECNQAEPLNEQQAAMMKQKLCLTEEMYEIHATPTNLILTEKHEFERLTKLFPKCEVVTKIELMDFNSYMYVVSYVNEPTIKAIMQLGGN